MLCSDFLNESSHNVQFCCKKTTRPQGVPKHYLGARRCAVLDYLKPTPTSPPLVDLISCKIDSSMRAFHHSIVNVSHETEISFGLVALSVLVNTHSHNGNRTCDLTNAIWAQNCRSFVAAPCASGWWSSYYLVWLRLDWVQ